MQKLRSYVVPGAVVAGLLALAGWASAQEAGEQPAGGPRQPRTGLEEPVHRVAARAEEYLAESVPGEHPLMPALRWAEAGLADMESIEDYCCTLVKRERIDGELLEHEYMFVKVRHEPFSVYMKFLAPARLKDREAIYVDGANDGLMLAHPNGIQARLVGTVSLKPTGPIAMSGNKYPITELGIRRLTERLLEVGTHDSQYGECEVKHIPGARLNGRTCTCLQVTHPVPRRSFRFHLARIYIDDELNLPVRYEAYDWPATEGGEPQLQEEYTYLDLKVNNGYTDHDFDIANPEYLFK